MKKTLVIIILLSFCRCLFSQEWTVQIDAGSRWDLFDVVSVDEGGAALCIGYTSEGNGLLVKIDKDGTHHDRCVSLSGIMLRYFSAVQLDDGNYMVFGVCDDSLCDPYYQRFIRVDIFNEALEPVCSNTYDVRDEYYEFFSNAMFGILLKAILSPSGTVFLAATPSYYISQSGYYQRALQLYEFDREGNVIAKQHHTSAYASSIKEITYEPHSENLLIAVDGGNFPNHTGVPGIYVVDTNLNILARQHLLRVQGGYSFEVDPIEDISCDGKWIDGEYMVLHAQKLQRDKRWSFYYTSLYMIDSALNVYGEQRLPPYDSCASMAEGTSTAYINDTTVFALTICSEFIFSFIYQANVFLLDKQFNLLGRKTFRDGEHMFVAEQPVAFNDGGCLVPIWTRKESGASGDLEFRGYLMKFRRCDIEITWDVVQESGNEKMLLPYPNPTDGIVNIPIPENIPNKARIQLFDSGVMKCLDKPIGQAGNLIRLDTGNLASGLYLYRIVSGNATVAEGRFVKN